MYTILIQNIVISLSKHFPVLLNQVRWPSGQLRRYKYGKQGYFEVELWYEHFYNTYFRIMMCTCDYCGFEPG